MITTLTRTTGEVAATEPTTPALVIQHGDTLDRIASRLGTTVYAVCAANPQIHDPTHIYPGQVIRIPLGTTG